MSMHPLCNNCAQQPTAKDCDGECVSCAAEIDELIEPTRTYMSISALAAMHVNAHDALPDCYQADDCLEFWEECGKLYAKAAPGQEFAIGDDVWEYYPASNTWVPSKDNVG